MARSTTVKDIIKAAARLSVEDCKRLGQTIGKGLSREQYDALCSGILRDHSSSCWRIVANLASGQEARGKVVARTEETLRGLIRDTGEKLSRRQVALLKRTLRLRQQVNPRLTLREIAEMEHVTYSAIRQRLRRADEYGIKA